VFDPGAVSRLWAKCRARGGAQLSNADNMALVGVLSTQLLHRELVRARPEGNPRLEVRTLVDRLGEDRDESGVLPAA
jgi:asparagine synthase (glutamine-hydrolysing)